MPTKEEDEAVTKEEAETLAKRLGNPRATDIPTILSQPDKYLGQTLTYGGEKLKKWGEEHYEKGNYGRAGLLKVAGSSVEKVGEVIEGKTQGSVSFNGGSGLDKLFGTTMNANPGNNSKDDKAKSGAGASWGTTPDSTTPPAPAGAAGMGGRRRRI